MSIFEFSEETTTDTQQINALIATMFNLAADANIFSTVEGIYNSVGNDLGALARAISTDSSFDMGSTYEEQATTLINNVGLDMNTSAGQTAYNFVHSTLSFQTADIVDLSVMIVDYLLDEDNRAPMFDVAAQAISNKAQVAEEFQNSGIVATSFNDLDIVSDVTSDAATVMDAIFAFGGDVEEETGSIFDGLVAGDDYTSATNTSGFVSVGGSATGEVEEANDTDWFSVSLTAGHNYQIDLEGSPTYAGTLSDTYLRGIYDSNGNFISGTTNDDSGYGLNSQVSFTADSNGTYYISAGAYSTRTGTYELSVTDNGSSDDYASTTYTNGYVSVNGSATGEIEEANDTDWFAVSLTAGHEYQIDLEGSPTYAGTLGDTYLRGIYDSYGNLISGTTNDDSGYGLNSQVDFTADSTGTYYISAGAYSTRTGTYELSVTDNGASASDDYASTTYTNGYVSVGGSATGNIEESYDTDWFSVSLTAGHEYQIDLEGSATSAGTISDPYLRGIYDSYGNLISGTTNDDAGTGYNAQVDFTADSSGTYYISAGGYSSRTGTYELSVTDNGSSDDYASTTYTNGYVSVGGSATGNIEESYDTDWFQVYLYGGYSYQIDLEGSPTYAGTNSDTYIRGVYDSYGNLISGTTNDDSGYGLNAQEIFTPTSTGTYYISAGAYSSHTGTYELSVGYL